MTDVHTVGDPQSATEPKRADESLGQLLSELTGELGDLFRKEVELAKVEARLEAKRAAIGAAAMVAAAVAALMLLTFLSLAAALALDEVLNRAVAFLIIAGVWAIIAAALVAIGRSRLRQVQPLPETTDTLKEDVQWAKTLKS